MSQYTELKGAKVVFMGTPEFSIPTLRALHEHTDVIAVITQNDSRSGRGKALKPTPVKQAALEMGLQVHQFDKINSEEAKAFLCGLEIDFIVVVAYGQVLKKWLIDLPKYSILNVHASILPKLRGAAPIQRAILEDFKETGVTIMEIDEGLDTGDMLAKAYVQITDEMDFGDLHDAMKDLGTEALLNSMLELYKGIAIPIAQKSDDATYAAMIKKSEAKIDWSLPGRVIFNQVRGFSPYMGAFSNLSGKRVKIMKSRFYKESESGDFDGLEVEASAKSIFAKLQVAQISVVEKTRMFVKVTDGVLEILEIQPENSKRMSASEYLRGYQADTLLFE